MLRLCLIIIIFSTTHLNAIEFKGKFLQGHYIIGLTDPSAKIIIDKKEVKVSKDGYFVFGIDRDRKFDLIITKISNGKKNKIIATMEQIFFINIFNFIKLKLQFFIHYSHIFLTINFLTIIAPPIRNNKIGNIHKINVFLLNSGS